ncbi:MAG: hypothetical protein ACOC2W_01165 [bacterium]
MKIANIIYDGELINHTPVDYVNYYDKPVSLDEIDNTLPTLYVGWQSMKSVNQNSQLIKNVDILDKRIVSNLLYWEFSFNEHKSQHVSGVSEFIKKVPEYYLKPKYKYINLDPVFFQIVDVDDLMYVLPKKVDKIYQYKDEMLYILCNESITGINIEMYDFFEFDLNEIIERLIDRCQSHDDYVLDSNSEIYTEYYKKFPDFPLLKRYIITFLTK